MQNYVVPTLPETGQSRGASAARWLKRVPKLPPSSDLPPPPGTRARPCSYSCTFERGGGSDVGERCRCEATATALLASFYSRSLQISLLFFRRGCRAGWGDAWGRGAKGERGGEGERHTRYNTWVCLCALRLCVVLFARPRVRFGSVVRSCRCLKSKNNRCTYFGKNVPYAYAWRPLQVLWTSGAA